MVVYKTTNLVNGKIYVGKDSKNKPTYLGSGMILKQAIEKYGKENFKKEILEYCSDLEILEEREIYWISELNSIEDGYNITIGGTGGDTKTNNPIPNNSGFPKGHVPWNKGTKGICKAWNKGKIGYMGANKTSYKSGEEHPFYGKKRDPKIYEKIISTRKKNGNIGKGLNKPVRNIEDNKEFDSCKEAAKYYNITSDKVTYSCRTKWKKSKFRFIE